MVNQLADNPFFVEHKLKLINEFLDVMDERTKIILIDNLAEMVEKGQWAFKNCTAPLIRIHIHLTASRLAGYLPRYANRINEIQEQNSTKMIGILSKIPDPYFFYDLMKIRDQDGGSMFTNLIASKQFNVLEIRNI